MKLVKWQELKDQETSNRIEDYIVDLKYNVEEIETSLDNDYVTHDQLQDEITTQIADILEDELKHILKEKYAKLWT
jgi:ATP-dependent RNA circularization protein (DNA/RNA ligase family)